MSKKTIEVSIFNHKFSVKTDNNEAFVAQLATYVNEKVEEVKKQAKQTPSINVALLACLNIAEEYLKFKQERGRIKDKTEKKVRDLIDLIDVQL